MRPGAMLVTSERVNRVNLNYIVRKLNACCDFEGGVCDGCPDKKICVDAYDHRCGYNPGKKKGGIKL